MDFDGFFVFLKHENQWAGFVQFFLFEKMEIGIQVHRGDTESLQN